MENTTNYNLQKYQSGDYFNPLTVNNPNLDVIDATMKLNSDRSIGRATELVSQGVHAITLIDIDCKTFKFIATGNFTAGETFTVNGIQVNAYTPSGSALVSNAFVTGSIVIASLNNDGNAITVYVSGTSTSDDSLKLGGELPAYYAKQSDMTQAESDITNLQNQNGNTSIVGIGDGTTTGAISTLNDSVNALKNYSSTETLVGYDVDGSPIYRQRFYADFDTVISGSGSKDTVLTTSINTTNVKRVVRMEGVFFNNNQWQQMPNNSYDGYGPVQAICLRMDNTKFYLHMYIGTGTLTIHGYSVVIEYVKNN